MRKLLDMLGVHMRRVQLQVTERVEYCRPRAACRFQWVTQAKNV